MPSSFYKGVALAAVAAVSLTLAAAASAAEVHVYSFREPKLMQPLFDAFTAKTGIAVKVVFAKDGLIERVVAEGANSPADVLLTNELGLLVQAREAGITQKVSTPEIEANVPAAYRDPAGEWIGLTRRARIVYASKDRVADTAITYEDLADPKWKGKICSRSGQHTYNIALVASMIAHHGAEKAEAWLKGLKENLARKPAGGDRDQVKAIFAGECDLAIGNTYYMGLMTTNEKEPEQKEWAAAVKVLFPNAADRGTHVNLSGAALMKSAPDKEQGLALIAFLSSAEAQSEYAALNHEYPVKEGVAPSELVQSWGELKADPIALEDIAKLRRQASELVDKVGFDNGPGT
ncbi:MAG: Fe(3+) ABC transporter substrate-binding protein [Hyphomicrobiaceae bacterium]